MGKAKAFFIITVFILTFICVQIFIYGKLDTWDGITSFKFARKRDFGRIFKRQDSKIKHAVSEYINICKELGIEIVLIDKQILVHFTQRVEQYSKEGKSIEDLHRVCHYFCNKNTFTFGVFKPIFQKASQWDEFSRQLEKKNFKNELLRNQDDRLLTLEQSSSPESLITHALSYNNHAIIHMVIFHERNKMHWSLPCTGEKPNRILSQYLKENQFCKQQNILKKFTTTTAVLDGLKITVPIYPLSVLMNLEQSAFIPCDFNRARNFYSKFGLDKSDNAEIFRIKAKNLLSTVKYHLDRSGIPFWLSSGTCLGWFRQCDFIPHSKDVDIGIFIKDYNPAITKLFKRSGLLPKHIFGKVEDSFELSFRTPSSDIKLDIFFFYEESDHMWNGGTQAKTGNKYKYRFPKFTLCWTEFVGLLVRVPCDTLAYVQANYGRDWNILIEKWDWKKSPSNVEENGKWPSGEMSKVVQVFQ